MAFKKSFKKSKSDKYLRLTGLWPSKSNDELSTGRVKAEDLEKLIAKFQEAEEACAPIVFSLWENEQESRKDPKFTLQCFVGDSEEEPRSNRKKFNTREQEEENDDKEDDQQEEEGSDEEQEEKPRKRTSAPSKEKKSSKRSSGW